MGVKLFLKNLLVLIGVCVCTAYGYAQSNSFPVNGYVGIGVTDPGSPLEIRKSRVAHRSHVIFGEPLGTQGEVSSSMTFAGWGLMHAGFAWVPTVDANGKLVLTFGGSEAPENNSVAVTFMSGGNVGIGTSDPKGYKLAVAGSMIAESIKVKAFATWPDYVFSPRYVLPSLNEVRNFIQENKHLPDIPSSEEVGKKGVDLGEMSAKLLKKIEELTLYVIDLKEENEILKKRLGDLENAD